MVKTIISPKTTAKIAELVKIELTDKELEKYSHELTQTLEVVKNLEKLNTSSLAPTYQTTGITNRFLNEQVGERTLAPDEALKNAAEHEDGLFKIPAINYAK